MAYPTFLIDSASGANPPSASGAGPATALSGTNASYSTTTITLDGSPNLSGVATDGSHAIYLGTSTGRRFFKITGANNTTKTVTVETAPTGTATGRSWAIGGKLASLTNANAIILVDDGTSGDLKGGWSVQFASGHAETTSSHPLNIRCGADTTGGAIVIKGVAGAASKPVVNFSGDERGIILRGAGLILRDFVARSTGTKTSSTNAYAIASVGASSCLVGMTIDSSTSGNKWYQGVYAIGGTNPPFVLGCTLDRFTGDAIRVDIGPIIVRHNFIRGAGGWGVNLTSANYFGLSIDGNVIDNCTSGGIYVLNTRADTLGHCQSISYNTIRGTTGADGIKVDATNLNAQICRILILDNVFASNGAYDVDFPNVTGGGATSNGALILSNDHYNATSGSLNPAANTELDVLTIDPAFVDATNANFTPGATGLQAAFPNPQPGGS